MSQLILKKTKAIGNTFVFLPLNGVITKCKKNLIIYLTHR